MPAKFELIAPCFFGCESTAKFELNRIGAENIRVDDGRLTFSGGAEMIAAANLHLRTVERVLLLLARYKASTFDELFDGVYSVPWEDLLPTDAAFNVFLFNTRLEMTQQDQAIHSLEKQMRDDDEIIRLRTNIRKAAEAKVANGTLTVTEMLRELTNESLARQSKAMHEIQRLMGIYQLKYTIND